jgi:hypothetical protein
MKILTRLGIVVCCAILAGCDKQAISPVSNVQTPSTLDFVSCIIGPHGSYSTSGMFDGTPYTVTLSNPGTMPVNVSQIDTAFFIDSMQSGSDQEPVGGIIAPGQSLNWTFGIPGIDYSSTSIPDTCQIQEWG